MLKKAIAIVIASFLLLIIGVEAQEFAPLQLDSIDFPDDVKHNHDDLLTEWSKSIEYHDNCTSLSDDPIFYEDSVYIERLYALPTKMELVYNQSVRKFIEMYAGRSRTQVSMMLGKGKFYFPLFEKELDKEGMPLELKYLPVIESALNPIAKSRVGATGIWQFMAPTGRMYGLEINSLVDERRDPVKATRVAVQFMRHLHNIFNDWTLVIAAYNCGQGNVSKAMAASGGKTDFWDIYPYLPKETRNYVPIFIAATYIMNYYDKHNICPSECPLPPAMDTVVIKNNIHFQQISDILHMAVEDLQVYNPQFLANIIPGNYKKYTLNMPIKKISEYIAMEDVIRKHRADELLTHRKLAGLDVVGGGPLGAKLVTHRAKRGDKLATIANQYGVTVTQLKAWNTISTNNVPYARTLKVYISDDNEQETSVKEDRTFAFMTDEETGKLYWGVKRIIKKPESATRYHTIKRGETLGVIAKKYGVTSANLKVWNSMKTNNLIAGKQLKVENNSLVEIEKFDRLPAPAPIISQLDTAYATSLLNDYITKVEQEREPISLEVMLHSGVDGYDTGLTDAAQTIYHKIRHGESLKDIASRYNVSVDDIIGWNNINLRDAKAGQRILIYIPEDGIASRKESEEPYDEVKEKVALTWNVD